MACYITEHSSQQISDSEEHDQLENRVKVIDSSMARDISSKNRYYGHGTIIIQCKQFLYTPTTGVDRRLWKCTKIVSTIKIVTYVTIISILTRKQGDIGTLSFHQ